MRNKLAMALSIAMLGTITFALPGYAQRGFRGGRGGFGMWTRPRFPVQGIRGRGFRPGLRGRRFYRPYRSVIMPYWFPPYYYSDYYYPTAPREAPPSQVVYVERSEPRPEAPPPPPPNALVLELQGNQWVRITDSGQKEVGAEPGQQGTGKASSVRRVKPLKIAAAPPRVLPPAVLVFRDGHREEITRYAIIGDTIYTGSDYWNRGSWTKKVPIAELNIPATLELNKERGTNFNLPSGPSVVVVRP